MQNFQKELKINFPNYGTRIFEKIVVGAYAISAQGSTTHYCAPKEIVNPTEYTHMEIAIFTRSGAWVQPREDEFFKGFGRYDELIELYKDGSVAIAPYVPVDLIQDLINYIYRGDVKVKIISIVNIKGGTGKTTTAINLAGEMSKRGNKVLLIDNDPQSNITRTFNVQSKCNLYDLYTNKKIGFYDCTVPIGNDVWILPNTIESAGLESELSSKGNRENILKNKLDTLRGFDYVIIDNNPFVSLVQKNALTISDYYLITIDNSNDSLMGIEMVNNMVRQLRDDMLNTKIKCIGVLRAKFDRVTQYSKQFSEVIEGLLKDTLLNTVIYESVKYKEARALGQFIQEYSATHAEPYAKLLDEIEDRSREG